MASLGHEADEQGKQKPHGVDDKREEEVWGTCGLQMGGA
jgi:hypothetical protein